MHELTTERVLRCAESIPPGTIATYGDIARIVGTGARHVGRIMAMYGSSVPWWRVTNARGELPHHLAQQAVERWRAEETPINAASGTPKAQIDAARADLEQLTAAFEAAVRDLEADA